MAFTELEATRNQKALDAFIDKRRPPAHVRQQVDLSFRVTGQAVELVEIRPRFDNPAERTRRPLAKITFVRAQRSWRLQWMRADRKWHAYDPAPYLRSLSEALAVVDADEKGCFFG